MTGRRACSMRCIPLRYPAHYLVSTSPLHREKGGYSAVSAGVRPAFGRSFFPATLSGALHDRRDGSGTRYVIRRKPLRYPAQTSRRYLAPVLASQAILRTKRGLRYLAHYGASERIGTGRKDSSHVICLKIDSISPGIDRAVQ